MSQFYQGVTAGGLPPSVPTSFVTDNGTGIPAANVLDLLGGFVSTNNNNGIQTTANPNNGNLVYVQLTNRSQNTITTTDATTTNVISFLLTADGTFTFDIQIAGFSSTFNEGVGYAIFGTVKSVGGVASVIGTPDKIVNEDVDLVSCNAFLVASGGSAVIQVKGIAGTTVKWNVVSTYVYVSS